MTSPMTQQIPVPGSGDWKDCKSSVILFTLRIR